MRPGDRVVTETLATRSEVEVVWQDGTVEQGVPSRELYPIHHLDDHEFFPGDFVTEARDGFHPHSYGVVQEVDHAGRCCRCAVSTLSLPLSTPLPPSTSPPPG